MARRGETYSALCTRLFGNMLEPERWHWQLDNGSCTTQAIHAAATISTALRKSRSGDMGIGGNSGIRSLSFGPHFYEMVSFPQEPLATYKEPHYLSTEDLALKDGGWQKLVKNLQTLRLPLLFAEATFSHEQVEKLLQAIPETMEHLALGAKGPIEGFEMLQQASTQVLRPFKQLISPLRFPRLKTLELEGWCIQLSDLSKLLLAHAFTLRTLHLINIYFVSDNEAQCKTLGQLGEFVADKMHLMGVEITNVEVRGPLEIPDLPIEDDTWLIPGQFDDDDWDGDAPVLAEPNSPMENKFLAGRPNNIRRRRPKTAPGHKGDDLGYVPAYW